MAAPPGCPPPPPANFLVYSQYKPFSHPSPPVAANGPQGTTLAPPAPPHAPPHAPQNLKLTIFIVRNPGKTMVLTVAQLHAEHEALQAQWDGSVEFKEVADVDHFYSDGISKGAILKIVLRYPDSSERINVVFIFPDGGYSEVFERPINHMISAWLAPILKKKKD